MAKIPKSKQNVISIIILVAGTAGAYLIFGPHKIHSQVDPQTINEKPVATVRTLVLGDGVSGSAKLEKTATFNSSQSSEVISEYSGKLSTVSFEVGDFVDKGQIIASFDQSSTENSAKTSFDSAQTGLSLAIENLNRTRQLTAENLEIAKNSRKIAEIQLEQAEDDDNDDEIELAERSLKNAKDLEDQAEESAKLQINGAEQQVNQARLGLEQARVAFENTIVRAPISGLIATKNVQQDDYLSFGQKIAEVVGSGKLEATVSLNKDQIDRIQVGDDVQIVIDDDEIAGEITSLSPIASGTNQRFEVKIQTIDDHPGKANLSGMIILNLSLDAPGRQNFFIPLEAVNIGQKRTVVFVVIDDRAVSREVELGEVVGKQVEIIGGLNANEEVVIENSRNLQEGQRIQRGSIN